MSLVKIYVASLDITSWRGVSIGAIHWYGKIYPHGNADRIEVQKTLSAGDALRLNKHERESSSILGGRHKPGEKSGRFDSKEEVRETAIEDFKRLHPTGVLFEGSKGNCSAHPLIYWPRSLKNTAARLNALATEWEKINGYEGSSPKRAGSIDDEWFALCKDAGIL